MAEKCYIFPNLLFNELANEKIKTTSQSLITFGKFIYNSQSFKLTYTQIAAVSLKPSSNRYRYQAEWLSCMGFFQPVTGMQGNTTYLANIRKKAAQKHWPR